MNGARAARPTEDELTATAPGGWGLGVKGRDLILVVLVLALGGLLFYLHDRTGREHVEITEELRLQSYILSLPADERPRLMPPARLFERMDNRRP